MISFVKRIPHRKCDAVSSERVEQAFMPAVNCYRIPALAAEVPLGHSSPRQNQ